MSDMRVLIQETITYSGTASGMRKAWPAEYAEFMADNPEAGDREWLSNCIDSGGFDLFEEIETISDETFTGSFGEVTQERFRQNEKWSAQHHDPAVWLAILMEEVGEAAQAYLEERFAGEEHSDWADKELLDLIINRGEATVAYIFERLQDEY